MPNNLKSNPMTFNISLQRAAQIATLGLFVLALIYTFYFGAAVLLPVFLAALLSIVLRPLVNPMRKLKMPDAISAAIVMVLLVILLLLGFNRLLQPASAWIERAPNAIEEVRERLDGITEQIELAQNASEELENITNSDPDATDNTVVVRGPTLIERSVSYTWVGITQVVLTFTLLYFFLAMGTKTLDGSLKLVPSERQRQYFRDLIAAVQNQLTAYLRSLAMIYAGLGTLTAIAMYLFNMPNPMLWGLMAFLMGFVPYVGPAITIVVISLVSFLTFENMVDVVKPIMAYGLLTVAEGFFITPNVLGRQLTMSPFAILLSIVFWSWIWGFAGTILAVPILACIKIVVDHAIGLRSVKEAAAEFDADGELATTEDSLEGESTG